MQERKAPGVNEHRLLMLLAVTLTATGLGIVALAHDASERVVVDAPLDDDFYGVGRTVRVQAEVGGDVIVAGQTVDITAMVTGDVLATGETVTLVGPLQDDVRVMGRTVMLTGDVGDHAILAGDTVTLARGSRVHSFAWLAGRVVEVAGDVGGDLTIAAETAYITGAIDRDVWIDAARITIGEHARIDGDLSWPAGHAPTILAGARINGRQIERPAPPTQGWLRPFLGWTVLGSLTLMVLTATLVALLRPLLQGAAAIGRARPGRAIGVGFLTLVLTPIAGAVALTTVIGAPVGVTLLLGYLLLLVLSVPAALFEFIETALASRGGWDRAPLSRRLGAIAVASLLFVVVVAVPILGALVAVVTLMLGLGALVLRLTRGVRAAA